ncbi:hypothetical protein D3C83_50530 [compost metagenome]
MPSSSIVATQVRARSTGTNSSMSPWTTRTGRSASSMGSSIATRFSVIRIAAGAIGAIAAHSSACFEPRNSVPAPPIEWPMR